MKWLSALKRENPPTNDVVYGKWRGCCKAARRESKRERSCGDVVFYGVVCATAVYEASCSCMKSFLSTRAS